MHDPVPKPFQHPLHESDSTLSLKLDIKSYRDISERLGTWMCIMSLGVKWQTVVEGQSLLHTTNNRVSQLV